MMKQMGGVFLMFSLMLYSASRDPVRNVAIIDAFVVGLCILAFTPLLSFYTLDVRALYFPSWPLWLWAKPWGVWRLRHCSITCGRESASRRKAERERNGFLVQPPRTSARATRLRNANSGFRCRLQWTEVRTRTIREAKYSGS